MEFMSINSVWMNIDLDEDLLPDSLEDIDKDGKYDAGTWETNLANPDTDFDGLNDGIEDANHNGIWEEELGETNPRNDDTDWDGLKDGQEVLGFNLALTIDGISTTRYGVKTDPLVKDSDGDGISDGKEALDFKMIIAEKEITVKTDPTSMDTDADELNDGLEYRGWTVGIHWERTMEHKETRDVYSNPTVKDTDSDGIKDYFEFLNGADPTRADTDGDGLLDNIEINPTDGTQISNPIGIEGEPPTMSDFHAEPVKAKREFQGIEYDWYKIKISFTVFDSAGLNYAIIDVIGVETKRVYFDAGVDQAVVEVEFDPDEWKSLVTGYDVKITVYDDNGNGGTMKRHIKSVMETLVEAFVGALTKIAKVITELASKAIDWIWDAIKKMLDGVLKPIMDAIDSWARKIFDTIAKQFSMFIGHSLEFDPVTAAMIIWLELSAIVFIIAVLFLVIEGVEIITKPFTIAITTLLPLIASFMKSIIFSTLIAGIFLGVIFPAAKEAMEGRKIEQEDFMILKDVFGAGISLIEGVLSFLYPMVDVIVLRGKAEPLPGLFWKKVGTTVALLMLFFSVLSSLYYKGQTLMVIDIILVVIAVGGIIAWIYGKRSPEGKAKEPLAPLTTLLEDALTLASAIGTWAAAVSHHQAGYYREE